MDLLAKMQAVMLWTKEAVMKIPKQTSTNMRKAITWKPVLSSYGNFSLNTMASQRTYSYINNQLIMTLALMISLFILLPKKSSSLILF